MKKKPYYAPVTTQVLMEFAVQILAGSNEDGAYGGDSEIPIQNIDIFILG